MFLRHLWHRGILWQASTQKMHDKRGTGGLQREVMPSNEFSFRDSKLEATNTSQCEPLSGELKSSYLCKLWASHLQQVVKDTEPSPSNPYPENILLNTHLSEHLGHTVLMHMEPWQLYFPSFFNIPNKPLFSSQHFIADLGLNEKSSFNCH